MPLESSFLNLPPFGTENPPLLRLRGRPSPFFCFFPSCSGAIYFENTSSPNPQPPHLCSKVRRIVRTSFSLFTACRTSVVLIVSSTSVAGLRPRRSGSLMADCMHFLPVPFSQRSTLLDHSPTEPEVLIGLSLLVPLWISAHADAESIHFFYDLCARHAARPLSKLPSGILDMRGEFSSKDP